jgi:hypothetical protein
MAKEPQTIIAVPELDKDGQAAQLVLNTMKASSGGITSSAWVQFAGGGVISMEICGDYREYFARVRGLSATQKNLDAQHAAVFTPEKIEQIKANVKAFYEKKKFEERDDSAQCEDCQHAAHNGGCPNCEAGTPCNPHPRGSPLPGWKKLG